MLNINIENDASFRSEFVTLQIMDNAYVPKEAGDTGKLLEPITHINPQPASFQASQRVNADALCVRSGENALFSSSLYPLREGKVRYLI